MKHRPVIKPVDLVVTAPVMNGAGRGQLRSVAAGRQDEEDD